MEQLRNEVSWTAILHLSFNYGLKLNRSLLGQDAILVTILRDPVAQYESMYTYYNLEIRNGEINEYLNR